jgi:hypothetical protein
MMTLMRVKDCEFSTLDNGFGANTGIAIFFSDRVLAE